MWMPSAANRSRLLARIKASGVTWIRIDVSWNALEPDAPGQRAGWYVERLDNVVDEAARRGLHVLAILLETPPWANGRHSTATPPSDGSSYGNVAHWLAGRYKGRVAAWEIWNEPNMQKSFVGTSPSKYVSILKPAYRGIKSADPAAIVVMGALAYNDTAWLRAAYNAGAAGFFDVLSTHPYPLPSDAPPGLTQNGPGHNIGSVAALRSMMAARDRVKPIWFTELGWSTHFNNGAPAYWRGVSQRVQGIYIVRALRLVELKYPYVTKVFLYDDVDRTDNNVQENNFGLLRSNLSEKPAFKILSRYLTHR